MDTQEQPRRPTADELAAQLRAQEKTRRPPRWLVFLLIALLFAAPLAGIVWWFWPGPPPPRVMIVAFDAVGRRNEDVTLAARVVAVEKNQKKPQMHGWPLLFANDPLVSGSGHSPWHQRTTTSGEAGIGIGRCRRQWVTPPAVFSYIAIYLPDKQSLRVEDRAQVFCWPKDAHLLLIDVERTLANMEFAKWKTANPQDIPEAKNAVDSLHDICSKKTYQIVYLACAVDRPQDYLRARAFVRSARPSGKRFPHGPILGRRNYGSGNEESPIREVVAHLRKLFSGTVLAVTRQAEMAAVLQETGASTFFLGSSKEAPRGTKTVRDWSEFAKIIP